MSSIVNTLHRLGALITAALVSLVVSAAAAAMPLVPEGDPPIKVRYVHQSAHAAGAVGGGGGGEPSGIDWSIAAVSAAYAAAIVLLVLAVAFAALGLRNHDRAGVAPTA